jgi:hypothetical protein
MRPFAKAGLVVGGYVVAFAIASAVVAIYARIGVRSAFMRTIGVRSAFMWFVRASFSSRSRLFS